MGSGPFMMATVEPGGSVAAVLMKNRMWATITVLGVSTSITASSSVAFVVDVSALAGWLTNRGEVGLLIVVAAFFSVVNLVVTANMSETVGL